MRIATPEEITTLELLTVELELVGAASVGSSLGSITRDRCRPVAPPERTVIRNRPLVLDDTPRSHLGK